MRFTSSFSPGPGFTIDGPPGADEVEDAAAQAVEPAAAAGVLLAAASVVELFDAGGMMVILGAFSCTRFR